MILETVQVGQFEVNCYILAASQGAEALIIDPGADEDKIRQALNKYKLKPAMVINTHGHFDHIGCDDKFGVPVYIHKDDLSMLKNPALNFSLFASGVPHSVKTLTRNLADGEKISLEGLELEVMHTPGHSRGGICLLLKKPRNDIVFSGDTLFCGGIGRTDFPGASEKTLIKSIKEKLLVLPDETEVYPGHGPASTIGRERKNNSFLA